MSFNKKGENSAKKRMKGIFYITFIVLLSSFSNAVVQIPCDFQNTPRGYECRLPDVDLSIFDDFAIIGGTHLPGQSDATVFSFMSVNNNFPYFPTRHIARFPALRHIKVSGSLIPNLFPGAVGGSKKIISEIYFNFMKIYFNFMKNNL